MARIVDAVRSALRPQIDKIDDDSVIVVAVVPGGHGKPTDQRPVEDEIPAELLHLLRGQKATILGFLWNRHVTHWDSLPRACWRDLGDSSGMTLSSIRGALSRLRTALNKFPMFGVSLEVYEKTRTVKLVRHTNKHTTCSSAANRG